MMIHTIHWDVIENKDGESVILIIWPAPIDHDKCFREAGFVDFADSDLEWDTDFRDLAERLVDKLNEICSGAMNEQQTLIGSFFDRLSRHFRGVSVQSAVVDNIIEATRYPPGDYFVQFDDMVLKPGCEHQLFKVYLPDKSRVGEIVDFVAGNRAKEKTHLDWSLIENL